MDPLLLIAIVLAVGLSSCSIIGLFVAFRIVRTFTDHISENAVIGGQPRDIAKEQFNFARQEQSKRNDFARAAARKNIKQPEEVLS